MRLYVAKVVGYLKKIIFWMIVLMATFLVLCLGRVMLWNYFAPNTNDVSDRVSNNGLNAIIS